MLLAIGLGVLGFVAMRRAHRRCHGYGYGHHPAYGWYGGWTHGPWHRHGHHPERWMLHAALARLDATPAQERVIVGEIDRLRERAYSAKTGLREARGDLAAALRAHTLDDAALGAALGRLDAATAEIRTAAIDALRGVHAVLDDKQRETLASFIDRSGGGWWRGGGPYR